MKTAKCMAGSVAVKMVPLSLMGILVLGMLAGWPAAALAQKGGISEGASGTTSGAILAAATNAPAPSASNAAAVPKAMDPKAPAPKAPAPGSSSSEQITAAEAEALARQVLATSPVWDGHNDVPIQLRGRFGNVIGGFDFHDTSATGPEHSEGRMMHTDLNRLKTGQVGAQFWSVYVTADLPEPEAVQAVIEQIDVTKRLVARYPQEMALALSADEVAQAVAEGKIASLMGMEGGHSIGSSLAILRQTYDLGARYMTLTHSRNTPWADSATDTPKHGGLTGFGRKVVQEMNRLGMLVDLSHVSEAVMHDTLEIAHAPVIFSHSGARAVNGHARNVPDAVLRKLPENDGIVMVVAYPPYVSEALRQWFGRYSAAEAQIKSLWQGQPEAEKAAMDVWEEANPMPKVTIGDLVDHIDHIRQIAGVDHIGIGGDYDGMNTGPEGMEDVTGYPALFTEMARRGYSEEDMQKIAFGNMMRVMRGAETAAQNLKTLAPIETAAGEIED